MKKLSTILCIMFYTCIQGNEITKLWRDIDHDLSSPLSTTEQLQLKYLFDKLQKFQKEALTEWTYNKNIEELLEIMELAVLQAPTKTRDVFKLKIIKIFKQFNINVYFTDQGLIEKTFQNSSTTNYQQNSTKKTSKKLSFNHKSSGKLIKKDSKKLEKIKGANRTRKKLEKAWRERKEAAKRTADLAQEKRNTKKISIEPTPADHFAQTIWEREMNRHRTRWQIKDENIHPDENKEMLGEL